MQAKHIYKTDDNNDVIDYLQIQVSKIPNQNSLNYQLRDLVQIANEIGYFSAAKFIATHIKEETKPPISCKACDNKMVQLDMLDPKKDFVSGCNLLSKQEWVKGIKNGQQTNCPKI